MVLKGENSNVKISTDKTDPKITVELLPDKIPYAESGNESN